MRSLFIAVLVLVVPGAIVEARETPEQACRRAERLLDQGDVKTALKIYTVALRAAHKAGDLVAEAHVATSLNRAMRALDEARAKTGAEGAEPGEGDLTIDEMLARLMRGLGTKHRGAVISGHHCALRLLLRATRTGDRKYTRSAAEATQNAAKDKGYGTAGQVIADYAAGFLLYQQRKQSEAEVLWNTALDEALEAGWLHLATHIATEIAARTLEQGMPGSAVKVMEKLAAAYPKEPDVSLSNTWQRLMSERMPNAPAALRDPVLEALGLKGGGSVSAGGGKGGAGGAGKTAGGPKTPLGKAWGKYGKNKVLVEVKRTAAGFEVSYTYDKEADYVQEAGPNIQQQTKSGITLQFIGGGVGLRFFDPSGIRGEPGPPGEGVMPPDFVSFHYLKVGETLAISKAGAKIK